jgi:hypothetical protein
VTQRGIRLAIVASLLFLAPAVRADERIGGEILVAEPGFVYGPPELVSDGLGTLLVWSEGDDIKSARLDGAGTLSGPFLVATGWPYKRDVDFATDGRNALAVWVEEDPTTDMGSIKAARVGPAGAPLDTVPITVDTVHLSANAGIHDTHVAFDGTAYRVVWEKSDSASDTARLFTRRVGIDGSLFSPRSRVHVRGMSIIPFAPMLACRGSMDCLVTWLETAGTYRVQGVRIVGDKIIDDEPRDLLWNVSTYAGAIATSGTDYLLMGTRYHFNCGQYYCQDAIVGRVSGDGEALDLYGLQVNNPPAPGSFVQAVGLAFDGTNYLATFVDQWAACGANASGYQVFGARVTPGGTVLNPDVLHDTATARSAEVAATRTHAVVAWDDLRMNQTCNDGVYWGRSVYAQRALAHADAPAYENVEIGAIGPRTIAEQAVLAFTVSAAALNPATAVFATSNLPPGAVFDAATRAFRWKPSPSEAGTYAGVHFEATDGVQTVSEDVTVSVTESGLSLCGTVEDGSGPVAGVAVKLRGGQVKPRVVFSDAAGQFCFAYLVQSQYKLALALPSSRQYRAVPLPVVVSAGDVKGVLFSIAPR